MIRTNVRKSLGPAAINMTFLCTFLRPCELPVNGLKSLKNGRLGISSPLLWPIA